MACIFGVDGYVVESARAADASKEPDGVRCTNNSSGRASASLEIAGSALDSGISLGR